ncbi:MAG: cytochrome b/b6 domain-containing protein [Salinivirgaceae bacterium]|jgi:thiosulfate reductase cytochrome b subunit|nr:cytochrome b/b6 domain-containing protein [Salinivirgaceae bacterium]
MKKVYIYNTYERFWHWSQALLIIFLAVTGFEIHGSFTLLGFELAVKYHNVAAISLIVLIVFTIFWHFTTGEWKQYIPTTKNLKAQVDYYILGIFKNAPHPTRKTTLSKLNPLQRLVYLALKVFIIPLMVITGILYLFYRYPQKGDIKFINIDGLENIAYSHTLGAFLLLAFLVVHLYLITTGHTVSSNLNAMITGYEELEEDETDSVEKSDAQEKKNA